MRTSDNKSTNRKPKDWIKMCHAAVLHGGRGLVAHSYLIGHIRLLSK